MEITSVLLIVISIFYVILFQITGIIMSIEDYHNFTTSLIETALLDDNVVLVFNKSNETTVTNVRDQMTYFSKLDNPKPLMIFGLDCDTPADFQKSFQETANTLTDYFVDQNSLVFVLLIGLKGDEIMEQINATFFRKMIKWVYFGNKQDLSNYQHLICDFIYFENPQYISISSSAFGHCLEKRQEFALDVLPNISLTYFLRYGLKFHGMELKVGTFFVKPYLEFSNSSCQNLNSSADSKNANGIFWKVLRTMSKFLDFKFQLVCVEKKFDGAVKSIVDGKANFISPLVPTDKRMSQIDFSFPVYFDTFNFLTKKPGEVSRAFAVVRPYRIEVWLSIVLSVLITAFFISRLTMDFSIENDDFRFQLSYLQALWYLFGSLTNQGNTVYIAPRTPVRLALGTWWIFTLTAVSGFSGTLISFLNAPSLESAINTVEELADRVNDGTIKVGSMRGTSIQSWLMNEKYPSAYYKIGKTAREDLENSQMRNFDAGAKRALSGKYALVASQSVLLSSAIKLGEDNFHISEERVSMAHTSLGLPKYSPLKPPFNLCLTKMHQSGLVNKWKEDYFERYRAQSTKLNLATADVIDPDVIKATETPLTFVEVTGPFCIWGVGLGMSLIVFLCEMFIRLKNWRDGAKLESTKTLRRHLNIDRVDKNKYESSYRSQY